MGAWLTRAHVDLFAHFRYETSGVIDRFESTSIFCAPVPPRGGEGNMPGCHLGALEIFRRHMAGSGHGVQGD